VVFHLVIDEYKRLLDFVNLCVVGAVGVGREVQLLVADLLDGRRVVQIRPSRLNVKVVIFRIARAVTVFSDIVLIYGGPYSFRHLS